MTFGGGKIAVRPGTDTPLTERQLR